MKLFYITENKQLKPFIKFLNSGDEFGVDTETTGLSCFDSEIRLLQFSTEKETYVIDLFKIDRKLLKKQIQKLFKSDKLKIFHNAVFDLKFLIKEYEIDDINMDSIYDTMVACFLIFGGDIKKFGSLDFACHYFLGLDVSKSQQVSDWSRGKLSREQVEYAGMDSYILLELRKVLNVNLVNLCLLEIALIEFRVIVGAVRMHLKGMYLNQKKWLETLSKQEVSIRKVVLELLKYTDKPTMNFNSPKQVKSFLRENSVFVKDTSATTLKELKGNKIVDLVFKYKKYKKRIDSFGKKFLLFVDKETKAIHSNFRQIGGAYTGRWTSSKPNLQQLPHDKEYRECFEAREGHILITADYSQFELRILAEASQEQGFIQTFKKGGDIHSQTASRIFDVGEPDDEQRSFGKRINFGTVYGIGVQSLSEIFGLDEKVCVDAFRKFNIAFPTLHSFLKRQQNITYGEDAYTFSCGGRLCQLKKVVRKGFNNKNIAKNFPIQSSNADILKILFYEIQPMLNKYKAHIVNTIHDEIVVEVPTKLANRLEVDLNQLMVECASKYIDVPIVVDSTVSKVWSK